MRLSTLGLPLVATALLLAACGGGGGGGSVTPPPPPSNVAPTANAGPNQTVTSGVTVTLDGTGSTDSDGTIASYAWTQTAGTPAVTLSSATASQPTFAAPAVAAATTLTFSLTVTDNRGAASVAANMNVAVNPVVANGTVTGRVRFMRIPTTANGLNYANGTLQPARGVLVRAVIAGTPTVLATATTNDLGVYTLTVAANTNIDVVIVAQMLRDTSQPLPRWDFRAEDLDATTPTPYTYTDGLSFSSSAGTAHDVDIPSGFSAAGAVTGTRASAPFAILDTVYQAVQTILGVAPTTNFPMLTLDWATDNPGGETFFTSTDDNNQPLQHIVLSADVTEDTDEFDQHVIAHEFGHYIEFNFSRADNIGGAHGLGDKLDIRVAFGEGFGYAFAAIVLNDPVARDTFFSQTQFANCVAGNGGFFCSSTFNIETNPSTSPPGSPSGNYGCWCSESSVWSILWDLYDNNADANDNVALGFQPIWDVLVNEERTTHAFTSIFSFVSALKAANPASATAINTLAAAQNIDTISDAFGTGETHVPTNVTAAAALPLYTSIPVPGGPVLLRTVNDAGTSNTLGNHRFLRFTLVSTRTITINLSSSNTANPDPDFLLYRNGAFVAEASDPPAAVQSKTITNAAAGDYLIDAYDCANGCNPSEGTPGNYDLTVTIN